MRWSPSEILCFCHEGFSGDFIAVDHNRFFASHREAEKFVIPLRQVGEITIRYILTNS